MTYETITELYNQAMTNCKFYERENMKNCLINEIGVLRGAAYCLEMCGKSPFNDDFMHFIDLQNKYTKTEKDKQVEKTIKKAQKGGKR